MADILPPAPVDAPFTSYNWADWYKKVRDAINAGATVAWSSITGKPTTVATSGLTDLTAGTYTPTVGTTSNVSSSTAYSAQYLQVGSVVTVSGVIAIGATSVADTTVEISLPIVSNFTTSEHASGTVVREVEGNAGIIKAVAANDTVVLRMTPDSITSRDWWYIFTYRIL